MNPECTLNASFGNSQPLVYLIIMAGKLSHHCCVGHMFIVNNMTLKPVNDFVLSLSHVSIIIASTAVQTINVSVAYICAMSFDVKSFVIVYVHDGP